MVEQSDKVNKGKVVLVVNGKRMAEQSDKVNELLSLEKQTKKRSSMQMAEYQKLNDMAVKSKLIAFWTGLFFPGGGFFYLHQLIEGLLLFVLAFLILVISLNYVKMFLCLLLFQFITAIVAVIRASKIRKQAHAKLLEYEKEKLKDL